MTLRILTILTLLICIGAAKSPRHDKPKTEVALQAQHDQVWVGRSDKAQSCEVGSGIGLDQMSQELTKAGVKFTEKKKLPDDKLHIQMCGIDKGTMNVFLISRQDLTKAQALGFAEVSAKP